MVAALRCVRPQFQWHQMAYATEMKSIQLHGYRRAQPKDSNNNNNKGPLILAFDIRTCFTLLYIVQLFLTFADARGENHELIFLSIP